MTAEQGGPFGAREPFDPAGSPWPGAGQPAPGPPPSGAPYPPPFGGGGGVIPPAPNSPFGGSYPPPAPDAYPPTTSGGAFPPGPPGAGPFLAPPGSPGAGPGFGPGPGGPFGGQPTTFAGLDDSSIGRPPSVWLFVALGLALVGGVAALVLGQIIGVAFGAWAVAGPLAIGLLAVFSTADTRQRARAVYTTQTWIQPLYWSVLVVAAVGIMLSAWRIAQWAGRL